LRLNKPGSEGSGCGTLEAADEADGGEVILIA